MDNRERLERIANSPISFGYLKKVNILAGVLHLINAIFMLAGGFLLTWSRDIYTFYLNFQHISPTIPAIVANPTPQVFFTISNLGVLLALFPLISAIAHFTIAFPRNKTYNENLKKGINTYRWYEYAFSSSIMIFVIATFVGIWDFWSLSMIFLLNSLMIMFGYLMEIINQKTEKISWSAFIFGSISGGFPWIVIFSYFSAAVISSEGNVPNFVYLILGIYFVLFMSFAGNMVLQYKGVGKWKDYLYGERFYIILSLVAKTLLAWLVFSGVYSPF